MNDFSSPQTQLHKMQRVILLGFLAVALSLLFWVVARGDAILARDDNPRLVEAELRIQRGRILDRNGVVLAETIGEPDALLRNYPFPAIGPAVGYYSFRHGTAGIEAGFDAILRGEDEEFTAVLNRELLHTPQIGRDVQLTLDAALQTTAEALFGNEQGGLVLLEIESGNILAMVSHPGYNPNLLDENFDELVADETAPLLNRAVQGQYQPGLVLQPFILAAALDADRIQLDGTVLNVNRPVLVSEEVKQCQTAPPDSSTWADVLRHRCPGPMQDLADRLGLAGLDDIFLRFGLATPPELPLNTELPEIEPLNDPLQAGIGQDTLTVSPLQVALALATLGNDGRLPTPQLVTAVQDENGIMQPQLATISSGDVVTSRAARDIRQVLTTGSSLNFTVFALSGPDSRNGWHLALTPAEQPQYAIVVVVENNEDLELVKEIGMGVKTAVLHQE
ncbi:penicillin-binding transpeptidase domain-containing protein [Candidatus Leptofilum sp.]|uniref:penicillin-binding transpeptidase domain-containing protein n=1 Tax=Candidatus Leptofilum sp. TaxID=3241576 RepID=UPI003B59AD39